MVINQETFEQLKLCVKNARPNEACGLIFGDIEQRKVIDGFQYLYFTKKFDCIEPDRKSPVEFLIINIEKLNQIFYNASQNHNLRLVSIFHSHPSGAHPSGYDLQNMKLLDKFENKAFKNQIWTIMDGNNYKLNGFIYLEKELQQIKVKVLRK